MSSSETSATHAWHVPSSVFMSHARCPCPLLGVHVPCSAFMSPDLTESGKMTQSAPPHEVVRFCCYRWMMATEIMDILSPAGAARIMQVSRRTTKAAVGGWGRGCEGCGKLTRWSSADALCKRMCRRRCRGRDSWRQTMVDVDGPPIVRWVSPLGTGGHSRMSVLRNRFEFHVCSGKR